ncbi:double homeobox protein A-like [Eptesicus fuscus]|uniref:double homeobox protein A-like n=1 Tax=Eptesicus fuscus TaxID=29078 RepID=UPI002404708A|nr:double homeobox protein A-like [Eptesicus fuscus]
MAQDISSDRMNGRRSRTRFAEDQVKILIQAFSQKPYPGYTTIQKLALKIDVDESRIQTWFQNRRRRHLAQRRSEAEEDVDANQDQDRKQGRPLVRMQNRRRQSRITYTPFQVHTLRKAFEKNPYPGIGSREQLAKEIGVPESKVCIWFHNQRNKVRVHRKNEPNEPLERNKTGNKTSDTRAFKTLSLLSGDHQDFRRLTEEQNHTALPRKPAQASRCQGP